MANSEIASVFKGAQFGVESTAGTGVAANKKLNSFGVVISPQGEGEAYAPVGSKLNTVVIPPGQRWCTASINGRLDYQQAPYLLSSAIKATNVSTPSGATDSRLWIYDLAPTAADAVKTYTVEVGDSSRAQKFVYGFVNDLTLEFSKQQANVTGSMLGRALQDDVTITNAPTVVALAPVFPHNFTVKLADTHAGLDGASELSLPFSATFTISGRHNPVYAMDGSTSFADIVEVKPSIELSITLAANDAGYTPLAKLTSGAAQFIRIAATGSEIESGFSQLFQLDFCGAVTSYPSQGEADGALTAEWTFMELYDTTWGKSFEIRVQNELTAL